MRKGQRILYKNYDITITVREVIFSLVILFVMIAMGLFISEKISSMVDEANQEYHQAVKISDNSEVFQYGMRTNIGNAFVHGTLKAVGPVTYPEINGEYAYVKKVKEKYTKHERIVSEYDSGGKKTGSHKEEYWTWDIVDTDEIHCSSIQFLDTDFEYGKINFPDYYLLDTIKKSSEIRYKYYVCDSEYTGSIYADLRYGTINNAKFINGATVDEAVSVMEKHGTVRVVAFWIFWVIVIIVSIYVFYYMENNWLEDSLSTI